MIGALGRILAARNPRERRLLALLALVAVPLAFGFLLALPLLEARRNARAGLDAALTTRSWYLDRQAEIAALPVPGEPVAANADTTAPIGLGGIEDLLIDAGLRDAVTLLANAPGGGVTLALGPVPFGPLMGWIDTLAPEAGYGLRALRVTRAATGQARAEMQLEPLP